MNIESLTGKKFNKLTVIKKHRTKRQRRFWLCRCDCGGEKIVSTTGLTQGYVKSCGCYIVEIGKINSAKGVITKKIKDAANKNNISSGVKNVHWDKNKWKVVIIHNKKTYYLGRYDNIEEAKNMAENFKQSIFNDILRIKL